jgi:tyrosine-protein kinase Etk/Wzc
MSQKKHGYNFDLTEIILFFIRNWKPLAAITMSSAVIAVIFSSPFFITPLYESKASFYAGTTNSVSSQLFYSIKDRSKDPLQFADLEVTEQFLQLLNSDEMKNRVIKTFDLMKHYQIDPESKARYQKLHKMYTDRISIRRTNFNSVEIKVRDHDADKAAEVANGIMYLLDGMKKDMQNRVAKQIFVIVEKTYFDKIQRIDSIKTRLKELGQEGVYDLSNQAKGISEIAGKGQTNQYTEKEKQKLGAYGGEVALLTHMLEFEAENLTFLRTKYDQAKLDIEADMSNLFIIDSAGASWDKVYPKRSIILVVSAIAGFVLGCVILLGLQELKRIKKLI